MPGALSACAAQAPASAPAPARRTIVVTAPTGKIGHRVVRQLLDRDVDVRIVARPVSSLAPEVLARRLPPEILDRVEVVRGSHSEAAVVDRAFAGADTVLWTCPPVDTAPDATAAFVGFSEPARAAIERNGVRRVISVTSLGRGTPAAADAGFATASLAMDDMLASTGVAFRALAMPAFMDNLAEQAQSIGQDGVFYSAVDGDRRVPACATRDIAASATSSLLDTGWAGRDQLAVLGPEDISFNQMAQIMTEVLGRPVRYQQTSLADYEARFRGIGLSPGMADAQTDLARAKNEGLDNAEPRTPENTTPTSFRQWCEEELRPAVAG